MNTSENRACNCTNVKIEQKAQTDQERNHQQISKSWEQEKPERHPAGLTRSNSFTAAVEVDVLVPVLQHWMEIN